MEYLEWVGYLASGIIVVSMMMPSIVKFRWINLAGAFLFALYGFLIGALPVGVLNGIIVLVDVYYLYRIYAKQEVFDILEVDASSKYLPLFLDFHAQKIGQLCPGYTFTPDANTVSFFILRNMSIAGLFLAHRSHGTVLNVELDYVLPEYKDFTNGKYVYFTLRQKFIDAGFTRVVARGNNQRYFNYLKKLGFHELEPGVYGMTL